MAILEVKNLRKIYTTRFGGNKVEALSNVNFSVTAGEFVAIMGESGSGKTTLLNILAALDQPTSGDVILDGKSLGSLRDKELSRFRRDNLGFVFQDFNLLDTFTLEDNIYLPLVLSGMEYSEMNGRLKNLAASLGISGLLKKYPYEVSGGQKQRAAVARAVITEPKLLGLFHSLNASGQTIVMVTHSARAASHASRVLFIRDGQVFHQLYRGKESSSAFYETISDTLTMLLRGGDQA